MSQADQSLPKLLAADHVAKICAERGIRFTPLRRIAFEIMLEFNRPVGAYDLIRVLQDRLGKRVNPPTAYRALEFLQAHGFITRIETRNAFVPSASPGSINISAFFLCNSCGSTVEMNLGELELGLTNRAAELGFRVGKHILEFQGVCVDCQLSPDVIQEHGADVKDLRR